MWNRQLMSADMSIARKEFFDMHIDGPCFKDESGRTLLLRGVNLGGSSKVPYPGFFNPVLNLFPTSYFTRAARTCLFSSRNWRTTSGS